MWFIVKSHMRKAQDETTNSVQVYRLLETWWWQKMTLVTRCCHTRTWHTTSESNRPTTRHSKNHYVSRVELRATGMTVTRHSLGQFGGSRDSQSLDWHLLRRNKQYSINYATRYKSINSQTTNQLIKVVFSSNSVLYYFSLKNFLFLENMLYKLCINTSVCSQNANS